MSARLSKTTEKGIYQKSDGTYELRVAISKGLTKTTRIACATMGQAIDAREWAKSVRDAGGNVRTEWRRRCQDKAPSVPPAVMSALSSGLLVTRSRTFGELVDEFQSRRAELVSVSNPIRRATKRSGRTGLRRTTLNNNASIQRQLIDAFGPMAVADIGWAQVHDFAIERARRGTQPRYVDQMLVQLRMIVGTAKASERPDDFPWGRVRAITPAKPRRSPDDPTKWGGLPGAKRPVLSFARQHVVAMAAPAAFRPAVYIEGMSGIRIGEAFGLQIGDFEWVEGLLWVKVVRQMIDTNEVVPWTKTDSSYRFIPLAPVLAEYLGTYARLYHGCSDLGKPEPELVGRQLIVNPAGRDTDGTFLPARRSQFSSKMSELRERTGLGHDELGYLLNSHHLRKSLSTYLLNAVTILDLLIGLEPEPDDKDAQIAYWRKRAEERVQFDGIHVSTYLGHQVMQSKEETASELTLTTYNLDPQQDKAMVSIARAIDVIVRDKIGDTLFDEPDETDLYPVHFSDDSEWVTSDIAMSIVGITQSNIWTGVRDGRLEGHLGWLADGGYRRNEGCDKRLPALPRLFISVASAKELARRRSMPSLKEVSRRLGMSGEAVARNFVRTGRLTAEMTAHIVRIEPDGVDHLVAEIEDGLLACFGDTERIHISELTSRFNKTYGSLFVEGRALERWVTAWAELLVSKGALRKTARGLRLAEDLRTASSSPWPLPSSRRSRHRCS